MTKNTRVRSNYHDIYNSTILVKDNIEYIVSKLDNIQNILNDYIDNLFVRYFIEPIIIKII